MYFDDFFHLFRIWEFDVVEDAAAQERVGQFFFRVGCDDYDGTLFCLYGFLCFGNVEFHFIQFPQQVVGEFQIGFVDFVDEEDDLLVSGESFPQLAHFYIFCDVVYAFVAELAVVQTLYHVINVQTILSFCGGFDVPDHQFFAQCFGNGFRQHGFACAGFPFDQQGFLQRHGNIDRTHEFFTCDIIFASLKCCGHEISPFLDRLWVIL